MAGPLGGDVGAWEHPPPYVGDIGGGAPWEAMPELGSTHHLMLKTSMAAPLRGNAGAHERPPPYVEDVDGGPPGM
jgi:hypothetical protein